MSDFDLYILKKYLFIPLRVLCIPILWGPALQCTSAIKAPSLHLSKSFFSLWISYKLLIGADWERTDRANK